MDPFGKPILPGLFIKWLPTIRINPKTAKAKMNYPAASSGRRSQGTEIMDAASLQFHVNTIAWSRAARRWGIIIVPF
jgi:hypothetical protein